MKHEKLMRAMSEIDEDLILEAHEERRVLPLWIRYGAIAACLLLAVLIVPQVVQNGGMDFLPIAKEEAEMDAATNMGGFAPSENFKDDIESPSYGFNEDMGCEIEDASSDKTVGVDEDLLIAQLKAQIINQALDKQGGAYPIGTTIENKHGSVVLTDRWGETIAVRVILLEDEPLSIYSATSGVWRLTVNGEAVEKLPDRAGTYEIVIDFSGDRSLDMIFIEGFGVFSISDW